MGWFSPKGLTLLSLYLDYILLDLLISSSVANYSVCVRSNIVWNRWKSSLKPKPRNKNVNAVYFYLSAEIFKSVARSLFTINWASDCKIMLPAVYNRQNNACQLYIFPNLLLTLKHYQSMWKYLSRDLRQISLRVAIPTPRKINLIVPGNWRCHAMCWQIIVFDIKKGPPLVKQKTTGKYCLGFCDCVVHACKTSGSDIF